MKNVKITLLTAGVAILLASCGGGSLKKDIKTLVDAECKKTEAQLKHKQNPDDKALEEAYEKARTELKETRKKLGEKYKDSDKGMEKAKDLYDTEMEKCQAKKDLEKWEEEEDKRREEEMKKLEEELKAMEEESSQQ